MTEEHFEKMVLHAFALYLGFQSWSEYSVNSRPCKYGQLAIRCGWKVYRRNAGRLAGADRFTLAVHKVCATYYDYEYLHPWPKNGTKSLLCQRVWEIRNSNRIL